MHASLTDAMTCPRCGPEYGLILLAEKVADRRILDGALGCANCRERYPVRDGFGDLRFGRAPQAQTQPETPADVMRLAALLGITEGPALVLVAGAQASHASALADLIEGIEVVAAWAPLAAEAERPGVSRFAISGNLPFRSASMRAVALTDAETVLLIEDAARVAAPRARVVVYSAEAALVERIERSGLRIIAKDERTTVAERVLF